MIVGVGCDIVKISRLIKNSDEIAERVLHHDELVIYHSYDNKRRIEFLAGRFAAKEAVYKAHNGYGKFNEINIYSDDMVLKTNIKDYRVNVSISHEEDYAIAYCIIEEV